MFADWSSMAHQAPRSWIETEFSARLLVFGSVDFWLQGIRDGRSHPYLVPSAYSLPHLWLLLYPNPDYLQTVCFCLPKSNQPTIISLCCSVPSYSLFVLCLMMILLKSLHWTTSACMQNNMCFQSEIHKASFLPVTNLHSYFSILSFSL